MFELVDNVPQSAVIKVVGVGGGGGRMFGGGGLCRGGSDVFRDGGGLTMGACRISLEFCSE